MVYSILITVSFSSLINSIFMGWLWYKIYHNQPLLLEAQFIPTATAPILKFD